MQFSVSTELPGTKPWQMQQLNLYHILIQKLDKRYSLNSIRFIFLPWKENGVVIVKDAEKVMLFSTNWKKLDVEVWYHTRRLVYQFTQHLKGEVYNNWRLLEQWRDYEVATHKSSIHIHTHASNSQSSSYPVLREGNSGGTPLSLGNML